jgi:hypothetical protein
MPVAAHALVAATVAVRALLATGCRCCGGLSGSGRARRFRSCSRRCSGSLGLRRRRARQGRRIWGLVAGGCEQHAQSEQFGFHGARLSPRPIEDWCSGYRRLPDGRPTCPCRMHAANVSRGPCRRSPRARPLAKSSPALRSVLETTGGFFSHSARRSSRSISMRASLLRSCRR